MNREALNSTPTFSKAVRTAKMTALEYAPGGNGFGQAAKRVKENGMKG